MRNQDYLACLVQYGLVRLGVWKRYAICGDVVQIAVEILLALREMAFLAFPEGGWKAED